MASTKPLTKITQPDAQKPPQGNYKSLLRQCSNQKSLTQGRKYHARVLSLGIHLSVIGEELVNMYSKCQEPRDARKVFDEMSEPSLFTWNLVIQSLTQSGMYTETLQLFRKMHISNTVPDKYTIPCVLKSCGGLSASREGMQIHNHVLKLGCDSDVYIGNGFISMYAKCLKMRDARQVFDEMPDKDSVSWTSVIGGYVQNGYPNHALDVFEKMRALGVEPQKFTFATLLRACGDVSDLGRGKAIHSFAKERDMENDILVGNALVAMYAKCGSLEEACWVFEKISQKNVVSWNAIISGYASSGKMEKALGYFEEMRSSEMIPDVVTWSAMVAGYAQHGHANEALGVLREMMLSNVKPNAITMLNCLQACAKVPCLQLGREIHAYVIASGCFLLDAAVGNALIDMYSKCGDIRDMCKMFKGMVNKDVITWSALISGYAKHGRGNDALVAFHKMQKEGVKAVDTTFLAVLTACSHSGLVEEGKKWFQVMEKDFGIKPRIDHYGCIVDLLGRAGHLEEAEEFIKNMPLEPTADVWGALLGASRIHLNLEFAERAAQEAFTLEPDNVGYHVILSNLYAELGKWDGVTKVRQLMNSKGLKKVPGCSWIDVDNKGWEFTSEDKNHPQADEIYSFLKDLSGMMKEAGYVPATKVALHDVDEQEKESNLRYHSEKMAVAFGLLNTSKGTTLRITKNLRTCVDCHNAMKFISKLTDRVIVVRDLNRFHHFKDGVCTCGDYW